LLGLLWNLPRPAAVSFCHNAMIAREAPRGRRSGVFMSSFDAIEESAAAIRRLFGGHTPNFKPRVAVVLGSGLGSFVDRLSEARSLAYSEVPHFPEGNR
jgi:hypothetical protein